MAVEFKPVALQEGIRETAPKRGPQKAAPRASTRSLKKEISGLLMTFNFAMTVIPPLQKDRLDAVEIDALAEALDEQCRQSPRFRKAVESALAAGSGGTLLGVCAIIGARRGIRHGLLPLPPEADVELGNLLAQGSSIKAARDAGTA